MSTESRTEPRLSKENSARMQPSQFELKTSDSEVSVFADDVEVLRYVFVPDTNSSEAPKPYMFPLRFTDGGEAGVKRPWDHRWHTGLQFTWSHVADQNFWGGPTFSVENGYQQKDNLGTMKHTGFVVDPSSGEEVLFDQTLEWITSRGEHWFNEHRVQRVHSLDKSRGVWAVDLSTELVNTAGRTLPLGSPTTAGRPQAGYTGWFWRGPRSWTGCTVVNSNGDLGDENTMGKVADWVAFSSEHDELDGGGTVLAFAGTSQSDDAVLPPIKWFTRTNPFTVTSQSPAFDEEIHLPDGGKLTLNHRFVFISKVVEGDELAALAQEFAL